MICLLYICKTAKEKENQTEIQNKIKFIRITLYKVTTNIMYQNNWKSTQYEITYFHRI